VRVAEPMETGPLDLDGIEQRMPQSARDVRLSHRCSQLGSEDEVVTAGEGATFHAEPPKFVGKRGRYSDLPTLLCLRRAAPGGSVRLVKRSVDHNRRGPSIQAYVLPGQTEGFVRRFSP